HLRELMTIVLFFFSSRRRHTRCYRDWSSDVCSSDLEIEKRLVACQRRAERRQARGQLGEQREAQQSGGRARRRHLELRDPANQRSEERRVGKECRTWWTPDYSKNNGSR